MLNLIVKKNPCTYKTYIDELSLQIFLSKKCILSHGLFVDRIDSNA